MPIFSVIVSVCCLLFFCANMYVVLFQCWYQCVAYLQCLLCMCVVYFQCWFLCVAYFQCWCQCVLPTFSGDVSEYIYIFSVLISVYVVYFQCWFQCMSIFSVLYVYFQCWYQCICPFFSVSVSVYVAHFQCWCWACMLYIIASFQCVYGSIFSDISGNQFTSVPSGVFQGLSSLTRLWVHTVFCPLSYSR